MSISPLLSRLHELPVCRVTDMPTAPTILKAKRRRGAGDDHDVEAGLKNQRSVTEATGTSLDPTLFRKNTNQGEDVEDKAWITDASHVNGDKAGPLETNEDAGKPRTRITFDPSADNHPRNDATLYIPGPRERDHGKLANTRWR